MNVTPQLELVRLEAEAEKLREAITLGTQETSFVVGYDNGDERWCVGLAYTPEAMRAVNLLAECRAAINQLRVGQL